MKRRMADDKKKAAAKGDSTTAKLEFSNRKLTGEVCNMTAENCVAAQAKNAEQIKVEN